MTTNTAKGIIDSLDSHTDGEIDHKHHAHELHKHATNLVNNMHAGAPHSAEALRVFEHAYMLMKSLGVGTDIGPEEEVAPAEPATPATEATPATPATEATPATPATPVNEAVTNLQTVPSDHNFVTIRVDQLSGMQGRNGIRQITSFVSSHSTLEEAHAAGKRWSTYPVFIAEVNDRNELYVTPRIKITND